MTVEEIKEYLSRYDGSPLSLMEICGSHTAAIAKYGIKGMLSPAIRLISGPGCPVCVTPSSYLDRLIALAKEPGNCVATFGDLLRVPGSVESLNDAKGKGANLKMVYAPTDLIRYAEENPQTTCIFAAVGFETTAPVYAVLLEEAIKKKLKNIRLLTSVKTMPAAVGWLMENGADCDGFLAPGHVCAVTGSDYFVPLAERYKIPFSVSGFSAKELLIAVYGLVRMAQKKEAAVRNYYPSVVTAQGNTAAMKKVAQYFEPVSAVWRGMGEIPDSGLRLRKEYASFDAGSDGLYEDKKRNEACRCGEILKGRMEPNDCPLYQTVCSPAHPQGACMVSYEGSCYQNYCNGV